MKKKKKKLHLFLGCVLVAAIAIFLFPDKNIAMQADHPHLGQLSTRTIISPINFDIPKKRSTPFSSTTPTKPTASAKT